MGRVFSFLILTSFLLGSCGPEKTAKQKFEDQTDQYALDELKKIQTLEGTYFGTVTRFDGTITDVSLRLFTSKYILPDPGQMKTEGIPVIKGSLLACMNRGQCFKKNKVVEPRYIPVGSFEAAIYEPAKKRLTTHSAQGVGNQITLHLTVEGDHVFGEVYSANPFSGYLDVYRVK
ncbi:MAG: hypothetical protein IPM57_09440 [Oligoflexia bacterium]|nr:hypothetical protein [Oligoflexia bacterium]